MSAFGRSLGSCPCASSTREASGNHGSDRALKERDAASPEPRSRLVPTPRSPRELPTERRDPLPPARGRLQPLPSLPSPNQHTHNFLWKDNKLQRRDSPLGQLAPGRAAPGPGRRGGRGGSHTALRLGDAQAAVTPGHTHTPRQRGRGGRNKGAWSEKLRVREGGRVQARVAAAGVCVCPCVYVRVCVRVRARGLTPVGRGSGSPRQEAGTALAAAAGQGGGRRARRTRSLHMEAAFLDD